MTIIKTDKELNKRHENDFYQTPYTVAIMMCNRFISPMKTIGIGCGSGIFGKAYEAIHKTKIDGIDIIDRGVKEIYNNFYLADCNNFDYSSYDLVIGNPPYYCVTKFVIDLLQIDKVDNLILLLPLSFLETSKRQREVYSKKFLREIFVMGRVSFYDSGKTDNTAYGVYHFTSKPNESSKVNFDFSKSKWF